MSGQAVKRGMFSAVIAALAGLSLSAGASIQSRVAPPTYRRPTPMGRSRIPGKPGRAGDKLARMAAEGRLGMGHPK